MRRLEDNEFREWLRSLIAREELDSMIRMCDEAIAAEEQSEGRAAGGDR